MEKRKKAAATVLGVLVLLVGVAVIVTTGDGDGGDDQALSSEDGCSADSHAEDLSGTEDVEVEDESVPDTDVSSYEPPFSSAQISCFSEAGETSNEAVWTCEYPSKDLLGMDQISVDTNFMGAGSVRVAVQDAAGETVFEETFPAPDRPDGSLGDVDLTENPDPSQYAEDYSEEYVYARTADEENTPGEWTLRAETSGDFQGSYMAETVCSTQEPVGEGGSGDTVAVEDLDIQTPSAWPTVGFDERRTSAFNSEGGGTGEELYRIDANERARRGGIPPVVASGLIFVPLQDGAGSSRIGLVNAYNVSTGEEVFSFEAPNPLSVPMVAGDGLLFVQTDEDGLYALDENGETVWHNDGGDKSAAMTFADGVIYATLNDQLFAIDAEDGEVIWQETAPEERPGFTGHPVVLDDTILVPAVASTGDDASLYALARETQELEWVYEGHSSGFGGAVTLVSDGTAFLGGELSLGGIHAVDIATGEQEWIIDQGTDSRMLRALPGGEILRQNETKLEALDPDTGELVWKSQVDSAPDSSLVTHAEARAVVVTEQTVYAWSTEAGQRTVQAFDAATGEMEGWSETHVAHDAVAVDGVLFSIGYDGDAPGQILAADGGRG